MQSIKVEVFLPRTHVSELIERLNEKHLITVGPYDSVYSETLVQGHWRPLSGADPYDGVIGVLSEETESKLEFRIAAERVSEAEALIRAVHPYETPMINLIPLLDNII